MLLASYEVTVMVVGFTGKVFGDLQSRWATLLADWLDRTARGRLSRFERRYRQYVASRHKFTDLKGLATRGDHTPELEDVFVDVSLTPEPAHEIKHGSLAETPLPPELQSPSATVRPQEPAERQSLGAFLDDGKSTVLAVIGPPGTGKTTLLEHTALRLARGGRQRSRRQNVPVLLFLRDHAQQIVEDETVGIADRIRIGLTGLAASEPPRWFEEQLDKGRCVVMLDGLDEVASERDRRLLVDWVERQIARYPGNYWILTSRPHGYLSAPLNSATVLQVRRFTGDQISGFLHGWYRAIERISTGQDDAALRLRAQEEAEDLLGRLRAQPMLYDLASNPLLLTMIANVHRYRGALPGSRAELYAEICQVLLWRRQEAKFRHLSTDELNGVKKETVLRELAFRLMSERIRDLKADRAEALLRAPLDRIGSNLSAEEFLELISASGLMVERELGIYSFAHQTFQEYLAAAYLQETGNPAPLVSSVGDPWWRETALLWAARTNPSSIIEECLQRGNIDALSLAFECLDEAAEVDPAVRRRLEDLRLVSLQAPHGSDRRRLMTGVTLARHFREVVRLTDDTLVCARPVTESVYRLFLAENLGNPTHTAFGRPLTQGEETHLLDISGEVATHLATWVNDLIGGESSYRLLRHSEAIDPALIGLTGSVSRYALWATADERFLPSTLYDPAGTVSTGWFPSSPRIGARVTADWDVAHRAAHGLVFEFAYLKAKELSDILEPRLWPVRQITGWGESVTYPSTLEDAALMTGHVIEALTASRQAADELPLHPVRDIADGLCRAYDLATDITLAHQVPNDRLTGVVQNLCAILHGVQQAATALESTPRESERPQMPNTLDLARLDGLRNGTLTDIEGAARRTAAYALRTLRYPRSGLGTRPAPTTRQGDVAVALNELLSERVLPLEMTSPKDLRRALAKLRSTGHTILPGATRSDLARAEVEELSTALEQLGRAIEPERFLDLPYAAPALRLGALALSSVADRAREDVITACFTVLAGVTVLQDRWEGVTPPCEVVFLVRA